MAGNQGHRHDWVSTFPFNWLEGYPEFESANNVYIPSGDTVIGKDVWIVTESMIMLGVHIGDGAIIGSRALITHDILICFNQTGHSNNGI